MQRLNQDKYIEFVLQLFEVTPKKQTKKGFAFHGERKRRLSCDCLGLLE